MTPIDLNKGKRSRTRAVGARRRFAWRLLGFSGLPLFSLLTPILLLPVLARSTSGSVWSSVAIGQSVGALGSLIISGGWSLTGPARIARAPADGRAAIYVEALTARLAILACAAPLILGVTAMLAPVGERSVAVAMALAVSLNGLSSAWYNIGVGRAVDIAIYEAMPRTLAVAAAAALLLVTHEAVIYPILLMIATGLGLAAFTRKIACGRLVAETRTVDVFKSIRRTASATVTEVMGGAYSSGAVALTSVAMPNSEVAVYVSGDKIYGMGLVAISVLSNALQGWVAEVTGLASRRRMRMSFLAHLTVGLVGGILLALLGRSVTAAFFGKRLAAPTETMILFGAAFLFVSLSTSVSRHMLIPLGRTRAVLASTAIGSAVGVPSIVILGSFAGSVGAAAGLALSQLVVLLVALLSLRLFTRSPAIP
jgi:O-antigen/teichoic acid export membrane protein